MAQEVALKVKEVIQRTHNVVSVRLGLIEPVEFKAGQFMKVILGEGKDLEHFLSISNSPTETGFVEFTKRISESVFSKRVIGLKNGDIVKLQLPLGKFTLEGNERAKIAFLSGGIGITPIRSMFKYMVDKNLGTDSVLIHGNRTSKDIAFREDFDEMQKRYPKLRVCHVLSEAEPGFKCTVGTIDAQIIRTEIPDFKERKFYLCGPPMMVEAMKKILSDELALPKDSIITENFQGY
ncbi:MAG: FAD-dependent oxidoreductase [Candidatus Eisenbacteria bacterium]|nr:FAD-dependent oxidoreductase [Candidatus Eisenbacteria bacterium]